MDSAKTEFDPGVPHGFFLLDRSLEPVSRGVSSLFFLLERPPSAATVPRSPRLMYVLIAYWEKRERGVVFSRPLRALRAA